MRTATFPELYGATVRGSETEFRLWAPNARTVTLQFESGRAFSMERHPDGTFTQTVLAHPGSRYFYRVNEERVVPDPVSRLLPEGVHGPTEIVDPSAYRWRDTGWRGLDLRDYILYELHVGTFSPHGTFAGVIERLEYLKRLGVSVLELMPVAAFPGARNWGYDGVSPYAVQAGYGGPNGLKALVDAAHQAGLGVVLDVVYNHLGNEGNYLRLFGPYFTDRHTTPWGEAINYDGPGSEGVRRYFIQNALYWIREYHLDGLRLDAIQTIKDDSPLHIVAEIQQQVQRLAGELGRRVCVIAESDENDARIVRPRAASARSGTQQIPRFAQDDKQERGSQDDGPRREAQDAAAGWGLDALWSDDFHHAIHAALTGERQGYYQDFGAREQIVRALNEGFVFQGEYFHFWGRRRGTSAVGIPLPAHVIAIQNHDQVGNRACGERLGHLVPPGAQKLAAALLLLAPQTPLLFMGEEYAESAPFQFFTDYGDPQLRQAVSEGRRREFKNFQWEEVPDPQDPATFVRSRLHSPSEWSEAQRAMLRWYQELIRLRRELVLAGPRTCHAELREGAICLRVPAANPRVMVIAEFPDRARNLPHPGNAWKQRLAADEDGYAVRICQQA